MSATGPFETDTKDVDADGSSMCQQVAQRAQTEIKRSTKMNIDGLIELVALDLAEDDQQTAKNEQALAEKLPIQQSAAIVSS